MADVPNQDRKLNLPRIEVSGRRFTRYDPTLALDIVERIADGELLKDICSPSASRPTIAKSTFLRWVSTVPELAKAYAAAQQISALSFEENAIAKATAVSNEPGSAVNVAAANLYVSQMRWSAARRNPTKYSDKGNTQIVVPVNITTTLDMGKGAGAIDVEVPDMYSFSLPKPEAEEAEYREIDDKSTGEGASEALDASTPPAREQLGEILDTTKPVRGVSHQPLFQHPPKPNNGWPGPHKRVLVPGNKRPLHGNSKAVREMKKNNDPV